MWLKDRLDDLLSLFFGSPEPLEEPAPPPAHPPRRPDQQRRGTLRRAGSLRHNPQWGDEYDEPDNNRRSMPVIMEETRYSSNNPYKNYNRSSTSTPQPPPPRRPRRSYIPDSPYHTDTSVAENPWYDDEDACSLGGATQCGAESKRSSVMSATITRPGSASDRVFEIETQTEGFTTGAERLLLYPPGDVLLSSASELQRRVSMRRQPSDPGRYSNAQWSAGHAPRYPPGDVLKNPDSTRPRTRTPPTPPNFSRRSIARRTSSRNQEPPVLELQHIPKAAMGSRRSNSDRAAQVVRKRSTGWDRPLSQIVPEGHRLSWSKDGKHIELVRIEVEEKKVDDGFRSTGWEDDGDDEDSDGFEMAAIGPMPKVSPEQPTCFI